MWARQRSWSWTTGKGGPNRPPLTLMASREFQVPWCPHHQQTIMVQTHQDTCSCEEGMTTPFPPQGPEKICLGPQILKNSTTAPSRASWLVASPPGMETARHLTVRPYRR
jgi:hypothetical protein